MNLKTTTIYPILDFKYSKAKKISDNESVYLPHCKLTSLKSKLTPRKAVFDC